MEYSKIEDLLDLYFKGKTTLGQEKSLRIYFTSDGVDERLKPYTALFEAYSKAAQDTFGGSLLLPQKNKSFQIWLQRAAALLISIIGVAAFMYLASNKAAQEKQALAAFKESRELMYLMANQFNKATQTLSLVDQFQVHKNKYLK